MKNDLSELERLLLISILRDRDVLAAGSCVRNMASENRLEFTRRRLAIEDARAGIVRLDFRRWRGAASTATQHQQNSRAVKRLVTAGLIEAVLCDGDIRTKFVKLTEAGEQLAKEFTIAVSNDQEKLEAAIADLKSEIDELAASTDRDLQRLAGMIDELKSLDQRRTEQRA